MSAPPAADMTDVRAFVADAIQERRPSLARLIARHFRESRPTPYNYLHALAAEGFLERIGRDNYRLKARRLHFEHAVKGLAEHEVWDEELQPVLSDLPKNVQNIWHYGCTEMINNVIDHSESEMVVIEITRSGLGTVVRVHDLGVGIFRKISRALGLEDERHAVLELSKGKVTTDPENHTGEGIFFSSRAFDSFKILSGDVFFMHENPEPVDYIFGEERPTQDVAGTSVVMELNDMSDRVLSRVFDEFATDTSDYRFDRTVVPVKLLQYGDDLLVSRSQAKRLLTRFERFRTVILDFKGVETIGQAFADEVFRVFPSRHPEVDLLSINSNEAVSRMINRAIVGRDPQRGLFSEGN